MPHNLKYLYDIIHHFIPNKRKIYTISFITSHRIKSQQTIFFLTFFSKQQTISSAFLFHRINFTTESISTVSARRTERKNFLLWMETCSLARKIFASRRRRREVRRKDFFEVVVAGAKKWVAEDIGCRLDQRELGLRRVRMRR